MSTLIENLNKQRVAYRFGSDDSLYFSFLFLFTNDKLGTFGLLIIMKPSYSQTHWHVSIEYN
jgi:hypothetical protein